jgi:predicted nucleic acid-binding protein
MVLVDTSVWIDFFQSPAAPVAMELEKLIKDHNRVVLCGVVLQEVLQGIRSNKSYQLVRDRLLKFPYAPDHRETWLLASELYRHLRLKGITLPPVDVTIAAIAIRNDLVLFSRDNHFETVVQHTALRLYQ